ncbi:hypothetical protein GCM10010517_72090 [Streptosporangium fragile]|uniref:Uncharacterized protein n=1 Tax=Streptosporangium fragile TaxID=46186 RepID=A0ABP6IQZ9_9ACTN
MLDGWRAPRAATPGVSGSAGVREPVQESRAGAAPIDRSHRPFAPAERGGGERHAQQAAVRRGRANGR